MHRARVIFLRHFGHIPFCFSDCFRQLSQNTWPQGVVIIFRFESRIALWSSRQTGQASFSPSSAGGSGFFGTSFRTGAILTGFRLTKITEASNPWSIITISSRRKCIRKERVVGGNVKHSMWHRLYNQGCKPGMHFNVAFTSLFITLPPTCSSRIHFLSKRI